MLSDQNTMSEVARLKLTPTDLANFSPKAAAESPNLGMLIETVGATFEFAVTKRTVTESSLSMLRKNTWKQSFGRGNHEHMQHIVSYRFHTSRNLYQLQQR